MERNNIYQRLTIRYRIILLFVLFVLLLVFVLGNVLSSLFFIRDGTNRYDDNTISLLSYITNTNTDIKKSNQKKNVIGPCAINFYGLPRTFKDIVLPSIIENIILPNQDYNCDYYIHYYNKSIEEYDRGIESGRSGTINPQDVYLLRNVIYNISYNKNLNYNPIVQFQEETDTNFYKQYNSLLERIHKEKGRRKGRLDNNNNNNNKQQYSINVNGEVEEEYLYLPYRHQFPNSTIENIIKTWHSQQSVWDLMERTLLQRYHNNNKEKAATTTTTANGNAISSSFRYSRVAMFRLDVLYVTPIDIYTLPDGTIDTSNKVAIVPSFSKNPVNDRMIYGPVDAVQIWAAGRFRRLPIHGSIAVMSLAEQKQRKKRYGQYRRHTYHPGDGIHPETFLDQTIFPAIRNAGIDLIEYPSQTLCFLRVRSDASIRVSDCGIGCVTTGNLNYIHNLLQRRCNLNKEHPSIPILECNQYSKGRDSADEKSWIERGLTWKGCTP